MPIVKPFTFVPSTKIFSAQVNQNFDTLYNLVNGTSSNVDAIIRINDPALAPLLLNQLGAGAILILRNNLTDRFMVMADGRIRTDVGFASIAGGSVLDFGFAGTPANRLRISNRAAGAGPIIDPVGTDPNIDVEFVPKGAGQLRFKGDGIFEKDTPRVFLTHTPTGKSGQLVSFATAFDIRVNGDLTALSFQIDTGVGTFAQIPVLPGSDPTLANQAARKGYVDNRKTHWTMNWFIADPSTFPLNSFSLAQKAKVPGSSTFVATGGVIIAGSGTASGSFTVEIRRHPNNNQAAQTTIGALTLNPGTVGAEVFVDFVDDTLPLGAFVYPILTARSSPLQRDINFSLIGYQTPTS